MLFISTFWLNHVQIKPLSGRKKVEMSINSMSNSGCVRVFSCETDGTFHKITKQAACASTGNKPPQSCPWVGLTHELGWVGLSWVWVENFCF